MFHDHKDDALIAFFLFLISPLLWMVLAGKSAGIGQNDAQAWFIMLSFTITAYLAYIAVVASHKK